MLPQVIFNQSFLFCRNIADRLFQSFKKQRAGGSLVTRHDQSYN